MNCKNCKHWQRDEKRKFDDFLSPVDPDTCEEMAMSFEVRYCFSPLLMMLERPIEANQASVLDGSQYFARLATGPDFGCINFEEG